MECNKMVYEEITQLISTVGFPIAVTVWFMIRTEKVISSNTEALFQIKEVISNCKK